MFQKIQSAYQLAKELQAKGQTPFQIAAALNRSGWVLGKNPDGSDQRYTSKDAEKLVSGADPDAFKQGPVMELVEKAMTAKPALDDDEDDFRQDGRFQAARR